MSRKQLGVLLVTAGSLAVLGALGLVFFAVRGFVTSMKPLVVVESPAEVEVVIEEADTHTLWHDHRTVVNGRSVNHDPDLPSGFRFALQRGDDRKAFPLQPPTSTATYSSPNRESVAVGAFLPTRPGSYTLQIDHPNEQRVFSLTRGSFLQSMGRFAVQIVLTVALSLVGVVLLIIGIVRLATSSKTPSSPSVPSPPPPPRS